jgi:tetratricopeptide (TPR) repeat protein
MNKNKKNLLKHKKLAGILVFILLLFLFQAPARSVISQKISSRANYYFNGGEYDLKKATNLYNKALAIDQKNWEAHYQLARINLISKDFWNGLAEIDKTLTLDHPQNKRAYYVRGLLDGYLKNYPEAERDFQNFIAWAPDEWGGYMDLSWIYINDGKYDDAVSVVNNALVLFPDNTWLYANKGLAEYKLGKYEDAKASLGIARKLAKELTPEKWAIAYPGNNPESAKKGVEEIKAAIDFNLKLAYEITGDKKGTSELNVNLADVRYLSKYAGKNDLSDGVTLSACVCSRFTYP